MNTYQGWYLKQGAKGLAGKLLRWISLAMGLYLVVLMVLAFRLGEAKVALGIGFLEMCLIFILVPVIVERRSAMRSWSMVVLCMLVIGQHAMHWKMAREMKPFRAEFARAVQAERSRKIPEDDYVALDYGGKIDLLLAKREAYLKKHGYRSIGGWYISTKSAGAGSDYGTDFGTFYQYVFFKT